MAKLSKNELNKRNHNIFLQKYFNLVLLTIVFNLVLSPIFKGDAYALEKASIPAFPGAEGAGAFTPGGRGGRIY